MDDYLTPSVKVRGIVYDPRMAYEIAQGIEDPAEIAARYTHSADEWEVLKKHRPFLMAVARYRGELKEKGYTFKTKAAMQAEDLLATAYLMAKDAGCPPAVRADLIKWTAKVAGYEPDQRNASAAASGAGFQININLGETPGKSLTIEGQALPVPA